MTSTPIRIFGILLLMAFSLFANEEGKVQKNQSFKFLQVLVTAEYEELEDGSEKVTYFLEVEGVQVPVKSAKKLADFENQMVNVEGKGIKTNDQWTMITKITKVEASNAAEASSEEEEGEEMPF